MKPIEPILRPRTRRPRAARLLILAAAAGAALWLGLHPRPPSSIPRDALSRPAPSERRSPAPALPAAQQGVLAAADSAPAGALPTRHLTPRDPSEWQGMLIDRDSAPPCEASATCGLARACKGGGCVACGADADCAGGEVCVLDHCVVRELASCRGRADCASGSLCILTGYSSEARGNEGMRAVCLDPVSGASRLAEPEPVAPDPRTKLPDDDLLRRAAEAAHPG